jgi:hypothetical protein
MWWDGSFKEVWLDNVDTHNTATPFPSCDDPHWRIRGYGPDGKPDHNDAHDEFIVFRQADGSHWKAKVRFTYDNGTLSCIGRFEVVRTTGQGHNDTQEITIMDWRDKQGHKVRIGSVPFQLINAGGGHGAQPNFAID